MTALVFFLPLGSGTGGVAAQTGPAVAGVAIGALAGGYVSAGIVTARARADRYLFSYGDLRWELVPVPALAVAGGVLGARDSDLLRASSLGGLVGFGAGTLAGLAVGRIVGDSPEHTWAGAIMGGAAGILVGSLAGGLGWEESGGAASFPLLSVRMGIP